jgi:hypothetical protein
MLENLFKVALDLEGNDLDASWHCRLAFLAPDGLRAVDILGNIRIVGRKSAH